jgi:hypothetical protein
MGLITDGMEAIGYVRVIKRDIKTGKVIFDKLFKNQITNYARTQMVQAWGQSVNGVIPIFPSQIAVGTGNPPSGQSGTSPSDSALWNEVSGSRKQVDYAQQWLNYYIQYSVTYQQTEVIGTVDLTNNPYGSINLTEAGLFDANGNLFSHVMLNGVTHDNTSTLSIQWQILQNGN